MNLVELVSPANLAVLIKTGIIIIVIFYVLFALIIVRQVSLMTKVVEVPIAFSLRAIVWIHFLLSLLLLIVAFTIL